jgi:hypothetical protein
VGRSLDGVWAGCREACGEAVKTRCGLSVQVRTRLWRRLWISGA